MKKGIFRIIAGSLILILTLFALVTSKYDIRYSPFAQSSLYQSLGYGIALLIFGLKAFSSAAKPEVIIHRCVNKTDIAIKWFSVIYILFLLIITILSCIDYFSIPLIFSTVSYIVFLVYLLFYYTKKTCTLFSTVLLFNSFSILCDRTSILSHTDSIFFFIQNALLTTSVILYSVIAVKLYHEKYSAKTIKIMGYIIFGCEVSSFTISFISYPYNFLYKLLYLIYPAIILYYTSITPINEPVYNKYKLCNHCKSNLLPDSLFCHKCGNAINSKPTISDNSKA